MNRASAATEDIAFKEVTSAADGLPSSRDELSEIHSI